MNVYKSTLGLLLAGGLLTAGTAATALADGHGHGDHGNQQQQRQQQNNPYQYGQYGQYGNQNTGENGNDGNGQGEQENNGNEGNAHNCINPAGKERGWCRHNGQNGQNGYYGNNQNAQLQGIITGVSGDTISILQGLTSISFDATNAIRSNNVNGSLYPTRSITAYGYYDNN
ncbi:MAG: hypothetical protein ACYDGM_03770, partial [Vulcanimicrobiaceae bacterium]